jgi:DNA adenine methylase
VSNNANFTSNHAGGFGLAQHYDLVIEAQAAADRGALVIVSNHDTPTSRELYCNADEVHALIDSARIIREL